MAATSGLLGFIIVRSDDFFGMLVVFWGCFFLSCACSCWNQVQEKKTDALMMRTKNRPVAANRMKGSSAVIIGLAFFLAALSLFVQKGSISFWSCFVVVIIYNGLYTPLKKHTNFSLLIGALAGAFPLVFGWTCAGGELTSPKILLIYEATLLWQVPHFWMRIYSYRKDYIFAGMATPPDIQSKKSANILLLWLCAFSISVLMLAFFPFLHNVFLRFIIALLGCLLIFFSFYTLLIKKASTNKPLHFTQLFSSLDGSMALVLLLIATDSILY